MLLACVWVCLAATLHAQPAARPNPPADAPAVAPTVAQKADAILTQLAADGDTAAAHDAANQLLLQTAIYRPTTATDAWAEAGFAISLTRLFVKAELDDPAAVTARLLARPRAARELAYLAEPQGDDLKKVFALFLKLDDAFGPDTDAFPGLTAALCVVHDRPITRHINENQVSATDPLALFRYYRDHEDKMLFGVRDVPGPLLVWVVDSTEPIPQMNWALDEYAGDRAVGRRFFDIDYDDNHFRRGAPKKVTQAGFSLSNIRKFGGVCADQAYFAVQVGKAIGVPTTYTRGRDGDVSHAWVGYFEQRGRTGGWNFSEGRYSTYQGVRGIVEHPQFGGAVDDSLVSVLAEAITLPPPQRYAAAAMVNGALLLNAVASQDGFDPHVVKPPPPQLAGNAHPLRTAAFEDGLVLIQQALAIDPGYTAGWFSVADLAEEGKLTEAQKRKWAESVTRLCGDRYPDFAVLILRPILASIDDPDTQHKIWDNAFSQFRSRKDLAAEIRMIQGKLWEDHDQYAKAADAYEDVIRKFANDGPFVIDALERFEALLDRAGRPERIPVLYRETFRELDLPDRMAAMFADQSNYYRVGSRYVDLLESTGDTRTAGRVRAEITRATGLQVGAPDP